MPQECLYTQTRISNLPMISTGEVTDRRKINSNVDFMNSSKTETVLVRGDAPLLNMLCCG
jgi:hypothetical protein